MSSESLGQRTKRVIRDAGISPRILAAVTKIHFTTVYTIMRDSGSNSSYPTTVDALERTLDKLEGLIQTNALPFAADMPHEERKNKLAELLADSNN